MNKKEFETYLITEGVSKAIEYINEYSKTNGMPKTSKDLGIPGRNLLLILANLNSKESKMMLASLFGHRFNHITGKLY